LKPTSSSDDNYIYFNLLGLFRNTLIVNCLLQPHSC